MSLLVSLIVDEGLSLVELRCFQCQALLRVDDGSAGQQARCPRCQSVQTIPTANDPPNEQHLAPNASPSNRDLSNSGSRNDRSVPTVSGPLPTASTANTSEPAERAQVDEHGIARVAARPSHKGTWILICGVLGLLCTCPIFSISAWVMGAKELPRYDRGEIGREHYDKTRLGYYLGLGGSLFWITVAVCATIVLLLRTGA